MLMVAPSGSTNEDTSLDTPSRSCAHFMVTGRVAPLLLVAVFRAALELASAFACGLFGIVGAWTGPPLLCVAQNGHLAQAQKAQCVAIWKCWERPLKALTG